MQLQLRLLLVRDAPYQQQKQRQQHLDLLCYIHEPCCASLLLLHLSQPPLLQQLLLRFPQI